MKKVAQIAFAGTAMALALIGCDSRMSEPGQVVAMRRLSETQYRNSIADVFGADITVAGRFEPIIRPTHALISTGAGEAAISPAGLEQFDTMARAIAAQVFDEAHRGTFVKCAPKDEKQADEACTEKTLAPIGRYLFRRPMSETERKLYAKVADDATQKSGSYYTGLQLALAAMLVSPNFLYVVETAKPDPSKAGAMVLDSYARASRLSFLLWNTTPDDALLKMAEKDQLKDQAKLDEVAAKMVASKRLEDGVRAFFSDMLVYEKFEDMSKDPVVFPRFNSEVQKVLPEQMLRMIVDNLLTRNEDYRELFTTRHGVITRALGPTYNVPVHAPSGWEDVEFSADSDRSGLLGQAAFLALYSQVGRSSSTLRGRAVRELLLCEPVPDPPGNVNFTVVQDVNNPNLRTARMRLSAHATDASCKGCHTIIDPIGLSLERFDGIGAFRAQENGAEIDPAGKIDGQDFVGAAGLGAKIAANPATTQCVASRAAEYATGRPVQDTAAAAQIEKTFAKDGYRIQALFRQVATAPNMYQVPQADQPAAQKTAMNSN